MSKIVVDSSLVGVEEKIESGSASAVNKIKSAGKTIILRLQESKVECEQVITRVHDAVEAAHLFSDA